MNRWVAMLMIAAYAGALLASTSRSAPLLIVFGLAAGWCFLDPGRTRFCFTPRCMSAFVGLVVVSPGCWGTWTRRTLGDLRRGCKHARGAVRVRRHLQRPALRLCERAAQSRRLLASSAAGTATWTSFPNP